MDQRRRTVAGEEPEQLRAAEDQEKKPDDRKDKLQSIITGLQARREEVEDHLSRTDIPADKFVDFRVQVTAQLNSLDETIRRLKRRLRDIQLAEAVKIKPLTSSQKSVVDGALTAVSKAISSTAAIKDLIRQTQSIVAAAIKAGEAAIPKT